MILLKKEVVRDEFIRKRMERRRKIRKRRLITIFIVFVILLLCVGVLLSFTVFFPIDNISAKGSKIYSSKEILAECEITKGDNLFAVSRAETEKTLKKKLPYIYGLGGRDVRVEDIEGVTFERTLPGTLKLTVKDAVEFAGYKVDDVYYIVSSQDWVLYKSFDEPENLLIIIANDVKCKVGAKIEYKDTAQQEIISELTSILKQENIKATQIDTSNVLEIKLNVEGRLQVNLGTRNNITEKIKHLNGMLTKIPEEKSGKINLSMWSSTNKNGTFTAENN